MAGKAKQDNQPVKDREVAYKIRMVVEIKGSITAQPPLKEDTGIFPFLQWAVEDIEDKLDGICEIVDVKAVELREVDDD